jgi:hypothetical protein
MEDEDSVPEAIPVDVARQTEETVLCATKAQISND